MNYFVYLKAKLECRDKPTDWLKQATNKVLDDLTLEIIKLGSAPNDEQLDRYESVLQALKEEIKKREDNVY